MNNQSLSADHHQILRSIIHSECGLSSIPVTATPEMVAIVRGNNICPNFGGYLQATAAELKRTDPELYRLGWVHRRMFCKKQVAAGKITMMTVSEIKATASWADIVRSLELQGPNYFLDLLPSFETRGQNRGVASLFVVDRALADRLVAQSGIAKILDQIVKIEIDGSNPR